MANLYQKLDSMEYDGLFSGVAPAAIVAAGTIDRLATAATLKRGTVLAKGASTGRLFVLGETETYEVHEDFEGDGTEDDFTLAATTKPAALNKVTVDGTATTAYTYAAATGVITFTAAPANGKAIVAYYNLTDTGTADCILCNDTDVGTGAEVNAAVYVAGCFNPDKLIVADSYTMTEADKDKLRERGIYLSPVSD